jgi:hypothetical protein
VRWSLRIITYSYAILISAARTKGEFPLGLTTYVRVAADTRSVHTPTMTLKNAALVALIGTILMTALLVWVFVFNLVNFLRDLVPAVTVVSSFIYAVGCFSVMVFFYVFHRAQKS